MSLHLEQIYISLPDPHRCRRAAGVRQTPAPAPTCTGRGLLRQQHALFNRYLTHLTLPPRPPLPTCATEGTAFIRVGFCSRRIYGTSPTACPRQRPCEMMGLQSSAPGQTAASTSPQDALCKGQGEQVKKEFYEKDNPKA